MIGVDTNILIRYLTQDHPSQSKLVNLLFENSEKHKTPLYINLVTLCEVIWVLESCYEQSKEIIMTTIETMLKTPSLKFEHEGIIGIALLEFITSSADFTDCLIAKYNLKYGCNCTYTFDKNASKIEGFRVLK
jgi:predicted nucleic-acid-binding protein